MREQSEILFLKITLHRMTDHYLPKLTQALQRINSEELWKKDNNQNSIGGITLHMVEHVQRHINRYFEPTKNEHDAGIESYFPDAKMVPSELTVIVHDTYTSWREGMDDLITSNDQHIDMHSFYHLVEHTGYHLGQIIDRVQRLTGRSFGFCQNGINEINLRKVIEGDSF
ncbi:MAG: hypothetical protein WDZ91_11695 [Paenibacillaceae bacterium]